MSDAQDLPQARCNVTSMVRTTRSKSSWQSPARCPYPTNCSAVGKKLSLYIYIREGKARVLSSEAFRPKGKRKAGNVGRRSDLWNRANEGCQRLENRRYSG